MKSSFKRTVAGLGAFAVVGGTLFAVAASANAATNPLPWVAGEISSGEQVGTLSFYDASGNQITSGSLSSSPFAAYTVASGGTIPGNTVGGGATAYIYAPSTSDPGLWGNTQLTATSPDGAGADAAYTALPASIQSSNREVVQGLLSFNDAIAAAGISNQLGAGNANVNVYEVRVIGNNTDQKWYSADIEVNTAAGTWTQVYPVPSDNTSLSISATPASPTSHTTSVSLSGTLADTTTPATIPTGSVEVFNGTTDLGAATVNATTGAVSATETVAAGTNYNFKFVYTPTGAFNGSSSSVLAYNVPAQVQAATTTTVNGSTTGTVGVPNNYTATVSSSGGTPTGTVQFQVDGANYGSAVSVAAAASTGINYTPSAAGSHAITAVYTSDDLADFASSTSAAVNVTFAAPAYTPDPQNVTVHVPAGTKVISTPYTANHPLSLGTLNLSTDGTHFSTNPVNFGDPAAAAAADPGNLDANPAASTTNGVTITDTEAGSTGWTAHVVATDFTSGPNTIDSHALEFLNVAPKYIAGNNISAANPVTVHNVADVKTGGDFASINGAAGVGTGTVNVTGALDLHNVPTSTQTGDYTATLTFTIS